MCEKVGEAIAGSEELQLVDSLVTMMNAIVLQFAKDSDKFESAYRGYGTGKAKVPMTMCEKVVLGYSALHHLLLYLQHRNKEQVTWLANETISVFVHKMRDSGKKVCKDLGKMLIYLLISDYSWKHIAKTHTEESFTRRVKWMVQQPQYEKYDTCAVSEHVRNRVPRTFEATQTGRRITMFQVWFMQNNAHETLQSYNLRLGRPADKVRHGVLAQTKHILACKNWSQYFGALGLKFKSKAAIDQLLRFAVYNSIKKRYHRTRMSSSRFAREEVRMPPIAGCLPRGRGVKKPGRKMPGSRQPKRNPEATTPTSKSKPSMKRGPIPVKKPQQPQLMIQNEVNPDPDTTQQPRPTTSTNEPEHPDEKPRSTPEPIAQTPTSKPSITPVPIRQLPQQLAMQSEASSVSTQQQRPSSTTEAAHPGQQPKPNAPTPTPMPVEMIERFRRARLQANLTSIRHQQATAAVQPSINAPTPTRARVTIPAQIRQQQQQAMQNEVSAASIQQQRRVRPSSMAARPRERMIVSPNAPTPTRARTQRIPAQIRQQQQRQA